MITKWLCVLSILLVLFITGCAGNKREGITNKSVSSSRVTLSWEDQSSNELGFKIERKTGIEGTYREIATVGPNVNSYIDTGVSPATTYYYRVRAYNSAGYSSYTAEVRFETPAR